MHGLIIEGQSFCQNLLDLNHRVVTMERWPLAGGVSVRLHPSSNGSRAGMKPNYLPAATHCGYILGHCYHAPACREHLFCSLTEPLEQLAFALPEIFPALAVDNLVNRN